MLIQTLLLFGTVSCTFGSLMIGTVYLAWRMSNPDNGWDR